MAMTDAVLRRERTGSKFETYMWFFTRVSGILFLLMGAFNIIYANLAGGQGNMDVGAQMRWAFFPISFHVESSAVEVTPNFSNPFWQVYSFLLLAFTATHGYNGIRVILQDYVRYPLLLAWLKALLFLLWAGLILASIFLIFVFAG
ncbi:MAG: Succinate dehydrogenase/Fumarate reductase transmembrane subunit [Chloroflexi bacterium ADurb.Bin325]|nr:MAG: Succinate dehydrogenase/Fumarate reductase transmembrane subunit [Chloroflexi bacterium ADurb.Bin325]